MLVIILIIIIIMEMIIIIIVIIITSHLCTINSFYVCFPYFLFSHISQSLYVSAVLFDYVSIFFDVYKPAMDMYIVFFFCCCCC